MRPEHWIAILDFGSQYAQLIARRIREQNVYAEILPYDTPATTLADIRPRGIVLSGGPASVYEAGAPQADPRILDLGIPVLGICYGMQWASRALGCRVRPAGHREYGHADLHVRDGTALFAGIPAGPHPVWMSHGDRVEDLAPGFEVLAESPSTPHAAVRHADRRFQGIQFHPEVVHTPLGPQLLLNFLTDLCGCDRSWRVSSFVERAIDDIRRRAGEHRVLCAMSGGVDSAVTATLVHRAIGDRLLAVFVDNGLLRKGERQEVEATFSHLLGPTFRTVDASARFLEALAGVVDPETKRRRIGHTFIDVFRDVAHEVPDLDMLAQGTLYPDVIESRSPRGGPSATIKTHHNVGGLPAELGFELLEPLRELFKDEVRAVGRELGIPAHILARQPFPGPGLAVRILGEVTRERIAVLQEADAIFREEMLRAGLAEVVWQFFAVLLPVASVGVMGDQRTYENAVTLRAVTSTDGMTADWARLPHDLLARTSNRIINEVAGINRVVYDISSKPPATIEWE